MPPLDARGVTLVELMVALLLLVIALAGLAAVFPHATYGVVAGGYQSTATFLAQQKIDEAKYTPFASLSTLDTGGLVGPPLTVTLPDGTTQTFDGFSRSVSVSAVPSTTTLLQIQVLVQFQAPSSLTPTYQTTLSTMVAKP
jgi:prepilin-type N-terminal cleavage/methylation domain-containing protein